MFTQSTSLIIPTKNRPIELIKLLEQIKNFQIVFEEILIIDSSELNNATKIQNYCIKNNIRYFHGKPSTSYQRNFGLSKIKKNEYVMFMDDDVIFFEDTFVNIDKCIKFNQKNLNIAGFGFNQIDENRISLFDKLKKNNFFKYLDIYPSTPGKVSKSGWHSKILNLNEDVIADWVFTTICVFKRNEIMNFRFDETFGQYSYLEDLDFSLNLMQLKKKIYISAKSKFMHPKNIDRSGFKFGIIEVLNRYKIVKKFKLSKSLFFKGVILRF